MTLIIPVGEDPSSSASDEGDSLSSRSPDDAPKNSDDSVITNVCRTTVLQSVTVHSSSSSERGGDEVTGSSIPHTNDGSDIDTINQDSAEVQRSEIRLSVSHCDNETLAQPLVIYDCSVSIESIPNYQSTADKEDVAHSIPKYLTAGEEGDSDSGSKHENNSCQQDQTLNLVSAEEVCEERYCCISASPASDSSDKQQSKYSKKHLKAVPNCNGNILEVCSTSPPSAASENHFDVTSEREALVVKDEISQPSEAPARGEEEDISPTNISTQEAYVGESETRDVQGNFAIRPVGDEERKQHLRKLMQRRTISESSSQDCRRKMARDRLRHSFSASDSCDTVEVDLAAMLSKYQLERSCAENENVLSPEDVGTNFACIYGTNSASEPSVCGKMTRKSVEITDTLVNNVKKSMIEEYKELKKKNSSLNYDSNLSSPENNSIIIEKYKLCHRMKSVANSEEERAKDIQVVCLSGRSLQNNELCVSQCSGNSFPPRRSLKCEVSKQEEYLTSVDTNGGFKPSSALALGETVNNWKGNELPCGDKSSPPGRLETWKTILAEKRNSLKSHLRAFGNKMNDTSQNAAAMSISEERINLENSYCHDVDVPCPSFHVPIGVGDNERMVNTSSEETRCERMADGISDGHNNLAIAQACSFRNVSGQNIITSSNEYLWNNNVADIAEVFDNSHVYVGCLHNVSDHKPVSKLQEACHGIAKALHKLPKEANTDMVNNNMEDSTLPDNCRVFNSEQRKRCIQNISSLDTDDYFSKDLAPLTKTTSSFSPDINSTELVQKSHLTSIITTIKPPVLNELMCNEKSQQCPSPPPDGISFADDEETTTGGAFMSSEDDSDYCQTDECGDDCDYCSGVDAEDEEDDTCELCRQNQNLSPVCRHTRVMTNGSLKPLQRQRLFDDGGTPPRLSGSRSLVIQAALRRRRLNTQELCAIREYSITSDDQIDSDEEQSQDESMYDLSSSWRFGLCRDHGPTSRESTLNSDVGGFSLPSKTAKRKARIKSNSLPVSSLRQSCHRNEPKRPESTIIKPTSNSEDEGVYETGVSLPRRPPRVPKARQMPNAYIIIPAALHSNLRPAMGLQGLQQRPSASKLPQTTAYPTGPKTLAPRSPLNPNPPFGFPSPPSLPVPSPGSPLPGRNSISHETTPPPGSPRTNSRSGALVTRNFSISDDEGGQRLSRRQVTITRHESVYKEAADRGYHLPSSSPVDPYWLTWKLGVLQKTVEEVNARLEEAEKVVGSWGPIPQDSNLLDQHVHNVRKFRETITDLQRGIDDVNDQAARFSAHNVPLTPLNAGALHDLNNRWKNLESTVNDRWRLVAGKSREVTPLTPAQLASSVSPPWERAIATNKVPYYINHAQETTHWDHPYMMELLDSLAEFNHIKFSAYRTASKLRSLQKKLCLDRAKLQLVTDVFDEHGLRGQNDRLIDVNDMVVVLSTLYGRVVPDHPDVNTTMATDLCLNWLLNVYDSQRTGQMRVLSFRVGLICLCRGHLEEKYRYMFRLIADPNRLVDQRKLGLLLHDCVQVPRQLGEVAAFGGSNIEPSVRSCFTKAGKDRETIEAVHFLTWVQQEPQSLVWLAVLHRVAASENVQHQVKCNICKTYPITGLRYRCLKCLSFDMCQRCFFDGRSSKSHKITHPMHEYCTATTAGDEMKDFTKALKNKFKSKRSLQKHTKKGYLPVQTVLEGDPLESPSPSPSHNVSSQDMHSRLELYASRLAEVELRTNSNSTPDSEDEHGLIAQYCQSLSSSDAPFPVPKSPLQIMASVDADQKDELEQMIRDLEEENQALQAEYERLKLQQPSGTALDDGIGQRSEAEMLAEAKLLREHKGRLEARMSILEDHNRQLEAQLQRLRQLLVEQHQQSSLGSPNKSGTLQTKSVTASQLAMDSPAKINGHSTQGGSGSAYEGLDQMSEYVRPPPPPVGNISHMGNLFSRAGDLEKAVGSLVASMNPEMENGLHSGDQSDENDYDNTGINQASAT